MTRIMAPLLIPLLLLRGLVAAQGPSDQRLDRFKTEVGRAIDAKATFAQQMVDQVFSFGELGMQEVETSKYLSAILERNGFAVERGVAGIPTAWVARWGSGKPVIALGSDIDCIPQASQKPGVASHEPIIEGAPGHGEGHNSGVPLNILAALAVKDIMARERMPGTIVLWPGVAEEQLGSKAFLVRAGVFRDVDAKLFARAAALATFTTVDTVQVIGSAWRPHFNKPIAEALHANAVRVGMPPWDEKDQTLARAVQVMMGRSDSGLHTSVAPLRSPEEAAKASTGTGSDDIGDVTWTVPSVTLYYPANIPGTPGHNWADAIAMATPIAHKRVIAGAKVQAMTLLDLMLRPKLMSDAKDYFANVQTKTTKYRPLMAPTDQPATWLNAEKMAKYRDQMRTYYYDPSKYETYLKQLGISYPTVPMRAP